MIDDRIKNKLYQSCTLAKLSSGELIVSMLTQPSKQYVTMTFPFIIKDDGMEPFLTEACDRELDIALYHITFAKRASTAVADQMFEELMTNELDAFNAFIKEFVLNLVEEAELSSAGRVLH